jgi:hypothetical protein
MLWILARIQLLLNSVKNLQYLCAFGLGFTTTKVLWEHGLAGFSAKSGYFRVTLVLSRDSMRYRSSAWWNYLLDFREQVIHHP